MTRCRCSAPAPRPSCPSAVVWLLSHAAGFVNGAVIRVDGGVPTARHTWALPRATNRFPYDGFPQYQPPQTFADLVPPRQ